MMIEFYTEFNCYDVIMSHYASNELRILFRVKIYEVKSPTPSIQIGQIGLKGSILLYFTLTSLFFNLYMETTKTEMSFCSVSDVLANFRSGYFMQVKNWCTLLDFRFNFNLLTSRHAGCEAAEGW